MSDQKKKNERRILCTHVNTIQGIILHTVTSNVFFYFGTAGKEPLHPQRGMQTLFLLKPNSRDEGMILLGTVGGKETYGEGWTLLHKHFKRKELQEVPRGQSHSFPILAPFRTAHCSPASHCKQHRCGHWGPNRQVHVGPNQQVSQSTQFLPLERTD